jgi:16S rRNA (cytosine1402-N4)-methyltransferase
MDLTNNEGINFYNSQQTTSVLMETKDIDQNRKNEPEVFHHPVMVQEVIQFLAPKNGIFVDATVGGGGHAEAILSVLENGFLVGIDLDQEAIAYSRLRLNRYPNFRLFNNNFTELEQILKEVSKIPICQSLKLMGVLIDLGVSYHQIRTPERGFSYELSGPLDMRFGLDTMRKAQDIIRRSSLPELEKILREFGEERFYKRIARAIYDNRNRLNNTRELINLIETRLKGMPRPLRKKALQRTFQALRIATNDELNNLQKGLQVALRLLAPGGRIIILSYHSLEDRLVKQTFREFAKQQKLEILTKKPLRPMIDEVSQNPAAHSARLRAAIKIS